MLYRGATEPCLRDGKIYFLDVTGQSGDGWNHLEGLFAWFECGEYLYIGLGDVAVLRKVRLKRFGRIKRRTWIRFNWPKTAWKTEEDMEIK